MAIKYKHPPVTELVIGVYFSQPIQELRAEHIGLFWADIRDEFPKVQHNMPTHPAALATAQNEVFPLPRFWFIAGDDITLLQVQRNALLLNWRKRDQEYPHFNSLKTKFDGHYSKFTAFLREALSIEDVAIGVCELSYINVIEEGTYWNGVGDTTAIVPSFYLLDSGIPDLHASDCNLVTVFTAGEDLTLSVTIRNGQNIETGKKSLYYEFRASGKLNASTKAEADKWFNRAHDLIGRSFQGMTSPEAQASYWQPE